MERDHYQAREPAGAPGSRHGQRIAEPVPRLPRHRKKEGTMLRGFKNFLMQGDVIIIAVGPVAALAFSTLIKAFTDNIITPLVNAAGGHTAGAGLGWTLNGQRINVGASSRPSCTSSSSWR
jgi:hypothetical protein